MNATQTAYQRMITTPRSQQSQQIIEDGFAAMMELAGGRLFQEASFALDQATIDTKSRTVNGIANVEEVSRTGWLIRIEGMELKHYKQNPIVLASHMAFSSANLMPGAIGTIGSITRRDGSLIFKKMAFDDDPIAEAWWQKIVRRIVRMVSVGFLPHEWEYIEEAPKKKGDPPRRYIEIPKSELLEISPVSIGANRGAFIDTGRETATILQRGDAEADDTTNGRLATRIDRIEQTIKELNDLIGTLKDENQSTPHQSTPRQATTHQATTHPIVTKLEKALAAMN